MTTTCSAPAPAPAPATAAPQPGPLTRGAPWAAGLWSATYLALALLHLARGTAAPWTPNPASAIGSLSRQQGAWLVAALAVVGAALLGAVLTSRRTRTARTAAWLLGSTGLVIALVVGDTRTLAFVGYAPMLLLGLAGIGPATDVDPDVLGPSVLSLGCSLGGLAMVVVGARALRADAGFRARRDRIELARIGRWAVAVAVAVPMFYALTRVSWALGIPVGVSDEMLVDLGDAKWAGLGLALFALAGCLLTLGLVQRWGEVFWRWVPGVGGRPVPVGMAVVPALFVAALVTSAGLGFWRFLVLGDLSEFPGAEQDWAVWAPELLWPVWGGALATAALAYRQRREVTR